MDFQNFSITRNGNVTVSVPRFNITCDAIDSSSGELIKSFNVNFPAILQNFNNEQLKELFDDLIVRAIQLKLKDNVN